LIPKSHPKGFEKEKEELRVMRAALKRGGVGSNKEESYSKEDFG